MTSAQEMRGTGASRSWYTDEVEWIAYREMDDSAGAEDTSDQVNGESARADGRDGASTNTAGDKKPGKVKAEQFIAAPADAALRQQACPICQEEFSAEYHDGEQEWVFMDAVRVPPTGEGGKIYHASCLEELAKDRGGK